MSALRFRAEFKATYSTPEFNKVWSLFVQYRYYRLFISDWSVILLRGCGSSRLFEFQPIK